MRVNTNLDHISSRGAAVNDVFQTLHEAGGATAARVVSTALGRLLSIETEVHDPGKADSWGKSHLSTIRKGVFVVLIGSWEKLHTGRWGEVQFIWRELYALCALIYAELGLLAASSKKRSLKRSSLLHSLTMLDNASMLGSHLFRARKLTCISPNCKTHCQGYLLRNAAMIIPICAYQNQQRSV